MTGAERQLREEAARLLATDKVDVVLGYQRGTLPLRTAPLFARDEEAARQLVFDATCVNTLANYLPRLKGIRVGIVARGCDGRWVAQHIIEQRLAREQVTVLAVPCVGVISHRELADAVGHRTVMSGFVDGDAVAVAGRDWEERIPLERVIAPWCRTCISRSSPIVDVDLGTSGMREPDFGDVEAVERLSTDERWDLFSRETEKCIRCYACRQACPGCYCETCFVDRTMPVWVGGTDDASDAMVFHLLRALHLAGRCVDCGACEQACPQGVNIRMLNRRLERDAREMFGHVAGFAEEGSMISTFRPDDPEDFIL